MTAAEATPVFRVPLTTMDELAVAWTFARAKVDWVRVGKFHRPPHHVDATLCTTDPQGYDAVLRDEARSSAHREAAANLRTRLQLLPGWVKT